MSVYEFKTRDGTGVSSNDTTRMVITSLGNVGIGTSDPQHRLDAFGTDSSKSVLNIRQSYTDAIPTGTTGAFPMVKFANSYKNRTNGYVTIKEGIHSEIGGGNDCPQLDIELTSGNGKTGTVSMKKMENDGLEMSVQGIVNVTESSNTARATLSLRHNSALDAFYVQQGNTGGAVLENLGRNEMSFVTASNFVFYGKVGGVNTAYMTINTTTGVISGNGSGLTGLTSDQFTDLDASKITTGTLPVSRGGTGVSTSTGTGSVVLSESPTLTGTVTVSSNLSAAGYVYGNHVHVGSYETGHASLSNAPVYGFGVYSSKLLVSGWEGINFYTGTNASTSPVTRMTIDAKGNVGIGTISPNAALQLGNELGNKRIVLWDTKNNSNQFFGLGINDSVMRYQVDGISANHVFYAGSGTTSSTELFRICGNGNVLMNGGDDRALVMDSPSLYRFGIVKKNGINTMIASGKSYPILFATASTEDVSAVSTNTYTERMRVDSSGVTISNNGSIYFGGTKTGGTWYQEGSIVFNNRLPTGLDTNNFFITRGSVHSGTDTTTRNHMVFHAEDADTCGFHFMTNGAVSRLFINGSNGNVGIGKSDPQYKLEVKGTIKSDVGRIGPCVIVQYGIYADIPIGGYWFIPTEAGNLAANQNYALTDTLVFSDASQEGTAFKSFRYILRCSPATSVTDGDTTYTMQGIDVTDNNPSGSNIGLPFTLKVNTDWRGYVTCVTPWFDDGLELTRHRFGLKVINATRLGSDVTNPLRIGTVMMQYC